MAMNVNQAKKFLVDIVKKWETEEPSKIVSLAGFAEKWSSTIGPFKDRQKVLYTNIRANKGWLKRNPEEENKDFYEKRITKDQAELDELDSKYGKYVPPKNKKKTV